jgi:hypothetical protein
MVVLVGRMIAFRAGQAGITLGADLFQSAVPLLRGVQLVGRY